MNIIYVIIVFMIQVIFFFMFGKNISTYVFKKNLSYPIIFILGISVAFSVFEILALITTLVQTKLSTLSFLWILFIVSNIVLFLINNDLKKKKYITYICGLFKKYSWSLVLLSLVIIFQMVIVFCHIDYSADASYYIGIASTNLYTNTLGRYYPYNGRVLETMDLRYLFSCYPDYNAVISQIFSIHPIQQAKIIMPEIFIIVVNMIYHQYGLFFFEKNPKYANYMVCFVFCINLYSNTIFTNANFLFFRTYEGKSVLANIIIPAILLCFLQIFIQHSLVYKRVMIFLLNITGIMFSTSSAMVLPVLLTVGYLVIFKKYKNIKDLFWYLGTLIPNIFVLIIVLLYSRGLISYSF